MSISKEWVNSPTNQAQVLTRYRSKAHPTTLAIAQALQTTTHNVAHILKTRMPEAERKALAKVRYSASKTGDKNPMLGKKGELHPRWIGECADGYGYLTCLHNGHRMFVHHVVVLKALGLTKLPKGLE